jgi:lipoprotein NlpI
LSALCNVVVAGPADDLVQSALAAVRAGRLDDALSKADQAVAAAPNDPVVYYTRASVYSARREPAKSIADLDRTVALDPKAAVAYDRRGSEYFKLVRIPESLADFDKYLELRPDERLGHWRRGITLYYAGKFEEGAKQFAVYEKVDGNDVENAVWHFLCNARAKGVEKARADLLKIGFDRRVPLMTVYDLFGGKAKPADVLAAVDANKAPTERRKEQLFYAHLYLGLYAEACGDAEATLDHLKKAAGEYSNSGYMGDVARVHVALRTKSKP